MDEEGQKKRLLDFAKKGLESRQYLYSAEICKSVLLKAPDCVEAMRILQSASKEIYDGRGFWGRLYARIASIVALFNAYAFRKSGRMGFLQKGLYCYPRNKIGLILLAQCALENKYWEMMLFAYEELHLLYPKDVRFALALGNAYFNFGDYKSALKMGEKLLATDPSNTEAISLVEGASLAQMKRG